MRQRRVSLRNFIFTTRTRQLKSIIETVLDGLKWAGTPWEVAPAIHRAETGETRLSLEDGILPGAELYCGSSSELPDLETRSFDLVITDPPFGDNIFYSDLANFFHAWLRLPLRHEYPELFDRQRLRTRRRPLAPRLLSEDEANEYYKVRFTACWAEACRVLKDGGLLAFTFHHSEDRNGQSFLKVSSRPALFLSRRFPSPVTSRREKADSLGRRHGYDIIHVCRSGSSNRPLSAGRRCGNGSRLSEPPEATLSGVQGERTLRRRYPCHPSGKSP